MPNMMFLAPGKAQKHFHTDAPTGRRCESAFQRGCGLRPVIVK